MKPPYTLRITAPIYRDLCSHLFPGDGDEHGAVIAAGVAETPSGTRLLARRLFLARDGVDYVPGRRGYRMLTAGFVAGVSDLCARDDLAYLPAHNHLGTNRVGFSADDLASHERGYRALLDITRGGPVAALVFANRAVAGDIWTKEGRFPLARCDVVGLVPTTLYPEPPAHPTPADPEYDRHARLFGDVGQAALRALTVGIIGLGGGGSLVSEWLARLGVGRIVAVDFDKVEPTNLPRVVGATRRDAMAFLQTRRSACFRRIGRRLARHKVDVARRLAREANPRIEYDAVVGDVRDEAVARRLTEVDFLVLASDTVQSRLVFTALVQQYLIPGVQIGVKIAVESTTGRVGNITAATRLVLPGPGGGCLACHELIPPDRLTEEALSEGERRAQRYVDDEAVAGPSVITLNAVSAATAVNDLMLLVMGIFADRAGPGHIYSFVRNRETNFVGTLTDADCLHCGPAAKSRFARGDRCALPCRVVRSPK